MYTWLYVIAAAALIWWAVTIVKRNPGAFSKKNFEKSFFTLGILALIIIGFVAIGVFILKH